MYRIDDRKAAIREVQTYLGLAGDPTIQVVATGVYDENTEESVKKFQNSGGLEVTGAVNLPTFNDLYEKYLYIKRKEAVREKTDSFITFPLVLGSFTPEMMHINRVLGRLLDYYGYTHNLLRDSNFFSEATLDAVRIMREIFLLRTSDEVDEELYAHMLRDHDSIENFILSADAAE